MNVKKLTFFVFCFFVLPKNCRAMNFAPRLFVSNDTSYYHGLRVAQQELRDNPQALHQACEKGDLKKAQQFIIVGASAEGRDIHGETPLHCATSCGHKKIVEFLLRHGVSVNTVDNTGRTPLHGAALNDLRNIAKLLLQYGGIIDIGSNNGWVARPHADIDYLADAAHFAYNNGGLQQLLPRLHGEVNYLADTAGTVYKSSRFQQSCPMLDERTMSTGGWTPLHMAVANNHKDMVELLLSKVFFLPTMSVSSSKDTLPLQEVCLNVLLNNIDHFDEKSLKQQIVSCFAHDLVCNPACKKTLQSIVNHAPLKLQQEMVRYWLINRSDEHTSLIQLMLAMHLQRHLNKIKDVIALKDGQRRTALNLGQQENNRDIVLLLDRILRTQKFSDLSPKMQSAIKHTIEQKLAIT